MRGILLKHCLQLDSSRDIASASVGRFGILSFLTSVGVKGAIRGFWSTLENTFCNLWGFEGPCEPCVVEGYVERWEENVGGHGNSTWIVTLSQCVRATEGRNRWNEIIVMWSTKHDLPERRRH